MMATNDHDLLIQLAERLERHSARESEVSRATLSELSKLQEKVDSLLKSDIERGRDIKDVQMALRNDDLRIATLEQQVESLQDAAEKAQAVADVLSRSAEKRIKQWSVISGVIVFILSNGPTILAWINRISSTSP